MISRLDHVGVVLFCQCFKNLIIFIFEMFVVFKRLWETEYRRPHEAFTIKTIRFLKHQPNNVNSRMAQPGNQPLRIIKWLENSHWKTVLIICVLAVRMLPIVLFSYTCCIKIFVYKIFFWKYTQRCLGKRLNMSWIKLKCFIMIHMVKNRFLQKVSILKWTRKQWYQYNH